ncbi:MAG TPA: DUF4157 domain-containing protein [Chitinophagaceae bacterium]|nr:DUF4157 domain-containing protein [Chitinophagaceae bacterium]
MTQQHMAAKGAPAKNAAQPAPFFQPKLSVNTPGDIYEQEADAMADKVMRMADSPFNHDVFFKPANNIVHRKCRACEEEEQQVQRKESGAEETQGADHLDSYVSSLGASGQPMPENSRKFFEPKFGRDFSNVRLHTDSAAAKSAQSINALAYTAGNNIVFNTGQYSPGSSTGQRLIAHELTHVVQQTGMLQRKQDISFELEKTATRGSSPREKVKNWMQDNLQLIQVAESKWNVDKRAIAGAIAWEALENVLPFSIRAVGPGKVHVKEKWYEEGNPVSKQVEDRGYLYKQTVDDRANILSTTVGSINYIGAILKAFTDIAATAGYNIKCDPAILCTFYNGFDLPKAEALFKTKKYPAPLKASPDKMGHWVENNIPYLEECVGTGGICHPGDYPTPQQGDAKPANVAAKSASAGNAAAYTTAGSKSSMVMRQTRALPVLHHAPAGLISRDDPKPAAKVDKWDKIAQDLFGKTDYAAYVTDLGKNSGTFFGMALPNCHQKMIDKFAVVEADLKKTQPAGYKPPKISDTFRYHKSMHGWGMAVDFDVLKNPYVLNEASDVTLNKQLPEVYDRIADFMLGKPKSAVNKIKSGRSAFGGKVDNVYDQLKEESDAMQQYFAFLDKTDDELTKFITDVWVPKHIGPPQDAPTIRKIIIDDYKKLGGKIGSDPKMPAPKGEDRPFAPTSGGGAGDPKTGFLNLDKPFVMAMTNAGFAWGAIDIPGQSGDIQHFDMRKDGGIGQQVMNRLYQK